MISDNDSPIEKEIESKTVLVVTILLKHYGMIDINRQRIDELFLQFKSCQI